MPDKPCRYFIATSGRASASGSQKRALAQALVDAGHEAALLLNLRATQDTAHLRGVTVLNWPSARPNRLRDGWWLLRLIRAERPTCLIAEFSAVTWMMLVGWLLRVPVRVAWHRTVTSARVGYSDRGWWKHVLVWRRKMIFRCATHLAANSEAAAADLRDHFGVSPERITVLYNALKDPFTRTDLDLSPTTDPQKIFCGSTFRPEKGQATLVRAAALLRQRTEAPFHIQFVGDGARKDAVEVLAAELAVADICDFAGGMNNRRAIAHLSDAAVAVVPSFAEAFGYVVIEAMALGIPVVASAVGGIPEVMRDGVDGFLVPPDDPDALADRLLHLLHDPDLRARLGRQARERFLATFEEQAVLRSHVRYFTEVAAPHCAEG